MTSSLILGLVALACLGAAPESCVAAACLGAPSHRDPLAARNWCAIERPLPSRSVRIERTGASHCSRGCTERVRRLVAEASAASQQSQRLGTRDSALLHPLPTHPSRNQTIVLALDGAELAPTGACRGRAGREGRGCCFRRASAVWSLSTLTATATSSPPSSDQQNSHAAPSSCPGVRHGSSSVDPGEKLQLRRRPAWRIWNRRAGCFRDGCSWPVRHRLPRPPSTPASPCHPRL